MVRVRTYEPEDYAQVKELLIMCGLFDGNFDTEEKFNIKKPKGSIIVAEDNSRIVGFILFTFDGWDSSIFRLSVHADYRKKGLGVRLLEEAEKRLKKFGANITQLGTKSDESKLREFYKKNGYGRHSGPFIWMEKKLK